MDETKTKREPIIDLDILFSNGFISAEKIGDGCNKNSEGDQEFDKLGFDRNNTEGR